MLAVCHIGNPKKNNIIEMKYTKKTWTAKFSRDKTGKVHNIRYKYRQKPITH